MSGLQANVQQEINKLQQTSAYVELYKLDASAFGGSIYYFTNQLSASGGSVTFAGQAYTAVPIYGQGFDISSSGTMPKPTITVSNVNKTLLTAVITLGDLVGAKITRIRTYEKFLDGGTAANTSAYTSDTWLVEQKIMQDASMIQWALTTELDRMGFRVGRQVLKDASVKNLYAPGVSRTRVT